MTTAPDADDQIFWQDRIGADETLLWHARASHAGGPFLRFFGLLIFGYGAYYFYKDIFIYSSADEACETIKTIKCEIFFYFAWPLMIVCALICALCVFLPLALKKGWLIRRYAITNRMAYTSSVGIRNAERSVSILGHLPVRMMGNSLKISNNLLFPGLTNSEIESCIGAVSQSQRGAQ